MISKFHKIIDNKIKERKMILQKTFHKFLHTIIMTTELIKIK